MYPEEVNYEMLEDLKDVDAFTEKYDSHKLKIKTPNVVMVFSNHRPQPGELALNRWKVFDIVDDHLEAAIPVDNKINYCWITNKKKKEKKKEETKKHSEAVKKKSYHLKNCKKLMMKFV